MQACRVTAWLVLLAFPSVLQAQPAASVSLQSQEVLNELLATDRIFSRAAERLDTVAAISAMFHDDVVMPLPSATFARGRAAAVEALRSNPLNLASRATWRPVRGGISADGRHGFTFGYMTLRGNDGTTREAKYLSYWVRTPLGWRVAAYKRAPRPDGEISLAMMPPALPGRLVEPAGSPEVVESHRQGLRRAERAFSDEAQRIGLGPAFQRNGSADAMNMGREAGFLIGSAEIGAHLPPGPSPVSWEAEDAIVASSGDLGVTWGFIRTNDAAADAPPPSPFFTIWRRPSTAEPWRYVAE